MANATIAIAETSATEIALLMVPHFSSLPDPV
jgi:hypothetical protein